MNDPATLEILLQRCFDGSLTDEEAASFLALRETMPEFDEVVLKNLEIEQIFRFFSESHHRPMTPDFSDDPIVSPKLGEKTVVRLNPKGAPFSGKAESFLPDPLDLDELVRLAAESKPLPAEKPSAVPPSQAATHSPKTVKPATGQSNGVAVLLFLVLAVAGIVAVYFEFNGPDRTNENEQRKADLFFARITAVDDPVFPPDSLSFKKGQRVLDETVRLESGLVELRLENGVRIVLEGPATFNIRGEMSSFCRDGRLSVEVPEGAEGFEVQTPLMNIRDLGTEFVVDVSETESTVHVVTGLVEVDRFSGVWTPVEEGLGMATQLGNITRKIQADKSLYVLFSRMAERVGRFETRQWSARQERMSRYENDPELVFHVAAGFQNRGVTGKIGARTVAGRRPGGRAYAFKRENDEIRLSSPLRRKSFTLVAWVLLENLSHSSNSIFTVGDTEKGAIHWQINDHGTLQLLLGEKDTKNLRNLASPSILSPRQCGTWLHLATTLDAENRTVKHYGDGREIASFDWDGEIEFDFSRAELGNWRRRAPTKRFLNGQIEEFLLLGRALSAEEIAEMNR